MLDQQLDVDVLRQQVPAFYYQRYKILAATQASPLIFNQDLNFGYGYLLRQVTIKYPELANIAGIEPNPILDIAYTNIISAVPYQNLPYPTGLASSQNNSGVGWAFQPSPVDQDGFGIGMSATALKNRLIYNLYYFYRQNIFIELRFRQNVPIVETYVDVMLTGYQIAEKDLDMWK